MSLSPKNAVLLLGNLTESNQFPGNPTHLESRAYIVATGKPAQPISHMVGFGIKSNEISMDREGVSESGQSSCWQVIKDEH